MLVDQLLLIGSLQSNNHGLVHGFAPLEGDHGIHLYLLILGDEFLRSLGRLVVLHAQLVNFEIQLIGFRHVIVQIENHLFEFGILFCD